MQSRYLYSLRMFVSAIDIICINVTFILAYKLAISLNFGFSSTYFINILIISNLLWALISKHLQLYNNLNTSNLHLLLSVSWKCICIHFLFFSTCVLITTNTPNLFPFIITFYLLLHLHLLFSTFTYQVVVPIVKNKLKKKLVALVGINPASVQLASYFQTYHKDYNYNNFLEEHECLVFEDNISSTQALCEQISRAAHNGVHEVYIALTPERIGDIKSLISEANNNCVRLKFISDFNYAQSAPFQINHSTELTIGKSTTESLEEMHNRFIKRLFDISFSLLVIIFVLSWLYPILALWIKLESKGPVIFKQQRNGRNNTNFWCYKFRSMRMNNESGAKQATKNDPRVTTIGRFMRKTSLDELPQFFNVLLGEMSVVGPRPHMLQHTEVYRNIIDNYMVRHYAKPGITGWAQVNGYRGETKDVMLMQKRVEYDIWYLENWSLGLDIKIVFHTLLNVFIKDTNAY